MWQAFGAAIALPLYFAEHLYWLDHSSVAPQVVDELAAQAIPFSFPMGALVPAVVGMLPIWLGPGRRSTQHHQDILAAWQPDPLWVSGIQSLVVLIAGKLKWSGTQGPFRWIRGALLLAALSSALGHLYVVWSCISSFDPSLSFFRMYVPFALNDRIEATNILLRGPWLFLQFDLIIITLSSISWIYAVLGRLLPGKAAWRPGLMLILSVGALTIGPGATVSLGLYWREGELHKQEAARRTKKP